MGCPKGGIRLSRKLATLALHAVIYGRTPLRQAFWAALEAASPDADEEAQDVLPPDDPAAQRAACLLEAVLVHWRELGHLIAESRAIAPGKYSGVLYPLLLVHLADALYVMRDPDAAEAYSVSIHRIARSLYGAEAAPKATAALHQAFRTYRKAQQTSGEA